MLTSSVDLLQSFRHLMHENEHSQGTEPTGKVIAYTVYIATTKINLARLGSGLLLTQLLNKLFQACVVQHLQVDISEGSEHFSTFHKLK